MKIKILVVIIIASALAVTGWRIWLKFFQNNNPVENSEQQELAETINGNLIAKNQAHSRPLAVVIENHFDSRPQSGLTDAEIVYETLAEGGITRYLAIFQSHQPEVIGPIRSARPYFNFLANTWGAGLVHSGGSEQALAELRTGIHKNLFDINEFFYGKFFFRNKSRFAPHNLYTTTDQLRQILEDKEQTDWQPRQMWQFKVTPTADLTSTVSTITLPFSQSSYQVKYNFDPATSSYKRYIAGQPDIDLNNNNPVSPRNVLVQLTNMSINSNDPLGTMNINLQANGPCYLFSAGQFTECRWNYDNNRFYYTTAEGEPLQLERGQTWIEIFPRDKQSLIKWN